MNQFLPSNNSKLRWALTNPKKWLKPTNSRIWNFEITRIKRKTLQLSFTKRTWPGMARSHSNIKLNCWRFRDRTRMRNLRFRQGRSWSFTMTSKRLKMQSLRIQNLNFWRKSMRQSKTLTTWSDLGKLSPLIIWVCWTQPGHHSATELTLCSKGAVASWALSSPQAVRYLSPPSYPWSSTPKSPQNWTFQNQSHRSNHLIWVKLITPQFNSSPT